MVLFCRDSTVSFETQDLIRDMLEVDSKKRLTATQVRVTLDNYMVEAKKKNVSTNQLVPIEPAETVTLPNGDSEHTKTVRFKIEYVAKTLIKPKIFNYETLQTNSAKAYIKQRNHDNDQLVPEYIDEETAEALLKARLEEMRKKAARRFRHEDLFPNGPLRSRAYAIHPFIVYPTTPPHESGSNEEVDIEAIFQPTPPEPPHSSHVIEQMQNLSLRRPTHWTQLERITHRRNCITESPLVPVEGNTFQPIVAAASSTAPLVRPSPSNPRNTLQSLFTSINEMFTRGNLTPLDDGSMRFNGIVTTEFVDRLTLWLVMEHGEHYEIKRIFRNSLHSPMPKVLGFFQRCGVRMSMMNGQHRVRRQQNLDLMVVLTYLLMACGYDNSYFMAPLDRPV